MLILVSDNGILNNNLILDYFYGIRPVRNLIEYNIPLSGKGILYQIVIFLNMCSSSQTCDSNIKNVNQKIQSFSYLFYYFFKIIFLIFPNFNNSIGLL